MQRCSVTLRLLSVFLVYVLCSFLQRQSASAVPPFKERLRNRLEPVSALRLWGPPPELSETTFVAICCSEKARVPPRSYLSLWFLLGGTPRTLSAAPLLFVFVGTEAKARLPKRVKTRALMPGSLCRHYGRSLRQQAPLQDVLLQRSPGSVATIKHESCLNPALESSREEAC